MINCTISIRVLQPAIFFLENRRQIEVVAPSIYSYTRFLSVQALDEMKLRQQTDQYRKWPISCYYYLHLSEQGHRVTSHPLSSRTFTLNTTFTSGATQTSWRGGCSTIDGRIFPDVSKQTEIPPRSRVHDRLALCSVNFARIERTKRQRPSVWLAVIMKNRRGLPVHIKQWR